MEERKVSNEELEKARAIVDIALKAYMMLERRGLIKMEAIPRLMDVLPEIISASRSISITPSSDLDRLTGRIKRDAAELQFTTEQVQKLAEGRSEKELKELLGYLVIGLKIAAVFGLI